MVVDYSGRTCTFFAADFEPQIAIARRVPEAAEVIQDELATLNWASGGGQFIIRDPTHRLIATAAASRLFYQSLGLTAWQANGRRTRSSVQRALDVLRIEKVRRIGFRTMTFVPLQMSHQEMNKLMFGSFLTSQEELAQYFGELSDSVVNLYGSRRGAKFRLAAIPQTAAQASATFLSDGNLEHFLERKYFDSAIKDFHDNINTDSFTIDVDMYREDIDPGTAAQFVEQSLTSAEELTELAVRRVKSLGGS